MKYLLLAACLLVGLSASAAQTVKVTAGHVCCANCASALSNGIKTAPWVYNVVVNGTTATVIAKEKQQIELVSLIDGMAKAGLPAKELLVSGPVTMTMGHLCCGGCVADLKAAINASTVANLDKQKITVDQATRTAIVQPEAGKSMNIIQLLHDIAQGGFSPTKAVL